MESAGRLFCLTAITKLSLWIHHHLKNMYMKVSKYACNLFLTFTFMHLADAFIQSDLQCIQAIHFFYQYVCFLGIEPTTFCAANAMLYH